MTNQIRCFILIVVGVWWCSGITFVRMPNNRGPAAVQAGRDCLTRVSRYYFTETWASRTKNMVIMHSANLSAPAADIEATYLAWMHKEIAEFKWTGIQLRVISNLFSTEALINVDPNAVILTDYYVLVVDDLDKLKLNMKYYIFIGKAYNPAAKFAIMYAQPDIPLADRESIAYDIFKLMYVEFRASNVVVCVTAGLNKYDVFITAPYRHLKNCGSLEPVLVGQCNIGRLVNDAVSKSLLQQPMVPERMDGCSFNFCARISEPYMEAGCNDGLEVKILNILSSIMQFKMNTTCTEGQRGEKMDGQWTDLLALLGRNGCDILVGGFFPDNDVHDDFAVSSTYMQDSYTWYVFLAPFQEPWVGLVKIFQPKTWLLFFVILILCAIAWWLFGRSMPEKKTQKELVLASLNTWAVFLGISANNRPDYTPLRVFFVLLAIYGLNVTTLYTSNLITMFTEPKHDAQLDTIEEIIAAGLPIGGREENDDWFDNDHDHDQIVFKLYNSSEHFLPTDTNLKRVRDGLQAMLINRFYVLRSSLRDQIYAVPGNVFSNPLEMITERGFPLLAKLNILLNRMKDAGLVTKILSDFLHTMNLREAIRKQDDADNQQIVLSVKHLQGAFAILIVGHLLSGLVFVMELISVTQRYLKFREACRIFVQRHWHRLLVWMKLRENVQPGKWPKNRRTFYNEKANVRKSKRY